MRTTEQSLLFAMLCAVSSAAHAQAPSFPPPSPEHALLQRFVGTWSTESECVLGPDAEPMKTQGQVTTRMLGAMWAVNEVESENEQTPVRGVQMIGYDPEKKKYIGVWIDSMTSHLWVYSGDYDPESRTLSLGAEGPDLMTERKTTQYRDSYEFVADDHLIARSSAIGEDGEWTVFMTSHYRRQPE